MKWHQLVLSTQDISWQQVPDILEHAWERLVGELRSIGELDVTGPELPSWFHIRRRLFLDESKEFIREIQILRLREAEGRALHAHLTEIAEAVNHVEKAVWCPLELNRGDSDEFFSFLQKLSYLRVVEKMAIPEELGRFTQGKSYEDCPQCRKAYSVMRSPEASWSKALAPWFRVMDERKMPPNLTHEYAHWFGHIMSGWWIRSGDPENAVQALS